MQVKFYFKQMEVSDALNQYTEQRVAALKSAIIEEIPLNVRYESKQDRRKVYMSCVAKDRGVVRVSVVAGDMYEAVDRAVDKLTRILYHRKARKVKVRAPLTPERLHRRAMRKALNEGMAAEAMEASEIIQSA